MLKLGRQVRESHRGLFFHELAHVQGAFDLTFSLLDKTVSPCDNTYCLFFLSTRIFSYKLIQHTIFTPINKSNLFLCCFFFSLGTNKLMLISFKLTSFQTIKYYNIFQQRFTKSLSY